MQKLVFNDYLACIGWFSGTCG